ncbi:MAG TPA: hypothetical protein VGB77_01375 [Abditibacteriaceae bacterium]
MKRKQNNIPVATFNRIVTQTGSKDTHVDAIATIFVLFFMAR